MAVTFLQLTFTSLRMLDTLFDVILIASAAWFILIVVALLCYRLRPLFNLLIDEYQFLPIDEYRFYQRY